jgi:hypothetical protein
MTILSRTASARGADCVGATQSPEQGATRSGGNKSDLRPCASQESKPVKRWPSC